MQARSARALYSGVRGSKLGVMRSANVIGSGPNGLAAAITLARAGVRVTVYEANARLGGACSSAELTLPGFVHDLGSSAYPMGVASPFFRSLPLERFGLRWIEPAIPLAHPLNDGSSVALEHDVHAMAEQLGARDGAAWESLFRPLAERFAELVPELLGPPVHVPSRPLLLAHFGLPALASVTGLAKRRFTGERARALFAGCGAHAVMPLTSPLSASVGMVLAAAGHASGWPVIAGGSQKLTDALARYLVSLGGKIQTGVLVEQIAQMDPADALFFDTSAGALTRIAGQRLSPGFRSTLQSFRQGPGVFKVDWALSSAIPWRSEACRHAGTVHVGGTLDQIAAAEDGVFRGRHPEQPFVLLVQPSVADPARAPAGRHTAWGYCHVPNGSTLDRTDAIEAQVERFAPGFRDCILARLGWNTAALESWNPNLVGGDLSGGAMTAKQIVLRPSVREYGTSDPAIYLCSSSTPPGGGVHGMCGFHAATTALRRFGRA